MANYIKNFSDIPASTDSAKFYDAKPPMVESEDFGHLLKYKQREAKSNKEGEKPTAKTNSPQIIVNEVKTQDKTATLSKDVQDEQVKKNLLNFDETLTNNDEILNLEFLTASLTTSNEEGIVVLENTSEEGIVVLENTSEEGIVVLENTSEEGIVVLENTSEEGIVESLSLEDIDKETDMLLKEEKVLIVNPEIIQGDKPLNSENLDLEEESNIEPIVEDLDETSQIPINISITLPVEIIQIDQPVKTGKEDFTDSENQDFTTEQFFTSDDENEFAQANDLFKTNLEKIEFDNPALMQLVSNLSAVNNNEPNAKTNFEGVNLLNSDDTAIINSQGTDIQNISFKGIDEKTIETVVPFNPELVKQSDNTNNKKLTMNNADLVQNLVASSASVILAHDDDNSEIKEEFLLSMETIHNQFHTKESFTDSSSSMLNINKNMPNEEAEVLGIDFAQDHAIEFNETIINLGGEIVMDTKKGQLVVSFPEKLVENADSKPQRVDQVASAMKFAVSQNKNQVKINLYPQALGAIEVNIEFAKTNNGEKSIKSIKIYADSKMTLDILEKSQAELQRSLAEVVESHEASLEFDMKNNQGNKGSNLLYENSEERKQWMAKFANDGSEVKVDNLNQTTGESLIVNSHSEGYIRIDSVNLKV